MLLKETTYTRGMMAKPVIRVTADGRIHKRRQKQFPNGDIYDCEFVNGIPDGWGTFQTKDFKYNGAFSNGLYEGDGEIEYSNGNRFKGTFLKGKRCGYGEMVDLTKNIIYNGHFHNDKFDGIGTFINERERMEGHWKNGYLHGDKCKIIFQNGDHFEGAMHHGRFHCDSGYLNYRKNLGSYTGSFQMGRKDGIGTRVYIDGQTYIGGWKANELNGYGEMHYRKNSLRRYSANCHSYVGEWQSGMYHGQGELTFNDDSKFAKYEGYFRANLFDGKGVLHFRGGGSYDGTFLQGRKHGEGKRIWASGNIFQGSWIDDMMHKGTLVSKTHCSIYVGSFSKDRKHGNGKEIWRSPDNKAFRDPCFNWLHKADGLCNYVGGYENGYFHGEGLFQASDGRMYKGEFVKGEPHGYGEAILLKVEEHGDATKMHIGSSGSLYRVWKFVGEWVHGKRSSGKSYFLDGSIRDTF